MGVLDRIDRWMWGRDAGPEQHAVDKTALWGQGADFDQFGIHAGVPVTQDEAVKVVAVYACVRLRSETIASLPREVFRERAGKREEVTPPPLWVRQPNPRTSWFELMEQLNRALDLDGNAYLLITARDNLGFPAEVWTLHPAQVTIREDDRGLRYIFAGQEPGLTPYNSANPTGDVMHIRNFSTGGLKGLSPIAVAAQAIGLSLAAEKQGARFYGRGQTLAGVITLPPSDAQKTQQAVDIIKANWVKQHAGTDKSHLPGILAGGATWEAISVKPEEAQFLETRRFQIGEIARLYGVPPHMIGDVERSTSWGTGIEAQTTQFFVTSIMTRLARLESALNTLTPRGQFMKFNVNGLLRGDSRSRAEYYAKGIQNGYLTRNEVRRFEDLPELPGLSKPLLPLNLAPVGETPAPPAPAELPPSDGATPTPEGVTNGP